jgi:hypothetical protein
VATLLNPYCSLDDLKAAMRITDSNDDDRLIRCINAASRCIEDFTNRRFWADSGLSARLFTADTQWYCPVDDFQTSDGLIVETDPNGDGTFPIVWAPSDYQLEPINEESEGQPWSWDAIRAVGGNTFPVFGQGYYPQPFTQALVRVTAKWGWSAIPAPVQTAAVILAQYLVKVDDVPLGATAFGETGIVRLKDEMPATVRFLLGPYSGGSVMIG